ncbi:MAG: hypothetical protein LBC94_00225 [Desulfovibrio sp.]|nr:hypothetical protein [Desulfovibrio sp.]
MSVKHGKSDIKLTARTIAEYWKRVNNLRTEFEKDTGKTWEEAPYEIKSWFERKTLAPNPEKGTIWCKSTYYLYRSALLWWMKNNSPVEETQKLRNSDVGSSLRKGGENTASLKLKMCPKKIMERLVYWLTAGCGRLRKNADYDGIIVRWLKAGIAAGLRPAEWEHASSKFEGDKFILEVKNAKVNKERGNGEYRHLIFKKEGNKREIDDIRAFLHDVQAWKAQGKPFENLYQQCRKRLTYVSRVHVLSREDLYNGQAISLYSARHQFAANMKASSKSDRQIAALMGHASTDTAITKYAKRENGYRCANPPKTPIEEINSTRPGIHVKKAIEWRRKHGGISQRAASLLPPPEAGGK